MDELDLLELEEVNQPSKTYRIQNGRIVGHVDGLDAVRQAVEKLLSTERFAYAIYTALYGVELDRFIGQDFDFAEADLEREMAETLAADERIIEIRDFELTQIERDSLTCRFTVVTVEGIFDMEREVSV